MGIFIIRRIDRFGEIGEPESCTATGQRRFHDGMLADDIDREILR